MAHKSLSFRRDPVRVVFCVFFSFHKSIIRGTFWGSGGCTHGGCSAVGPHDDDTPLSHYDNLEEFLCVGVPSPPPPPPPAHDLFQGRRHGV